MEGVLECVIRKKSPGKILLFSEKTMENCKYILIQRKLRNLKYKDICACATWMVWICKNGLSYHNEGYVERVKHDFVLCHIKKNVPNKFGSISKKCCK